MEDLMLDELQSRVGYEFEKEGLLQEALLQSVETAVEPGVRSNTHLAWFGDAIVEMFVSEALYSASESERYRLPDPDRQARVKKSTLAQAAKELQLDQHLVNSLGKPMPAYQISQKALAGAFEAVAAAIYVDGGWEKAREFVRGKLKL